MRLLVIALALAVFVVAAEAAQKEKCKGDCVQKGSCTAEVTTGKCKRKMECCVGDTDIKRNCNPTDLCDGNCKSKCKKGEKKFKNKKNKKYCEGKAKCLCCLGYCDTKAACSLGGGKCLPEGMKCKGTMLFGKGYCSNNIKKFKGKKTKCGCCMPSTPTTTAAPSATTNAPVVAPVWHYEGEHGPEHWADHFTLCGGSSQSPIDLDSDTSSSKLLDPWKFNRYDVVPDDMKISNNGHSTKVAWTTDNLAVLPSVSGGLLGAEYTFAQYHFHWGSVSTQGSEHTVDGTSFPAELHLVHFKREYGSLGEAIKEADGLAVLGIMLSLATVDNPALTPIIAGLATIPGAGDEEHLATFHALSDILPNTRRFYRYQGSLTTPTCNEVVTWTVFDDPIGVSEAQLEAFRSLLGDDGVHHIGDNFRPVMPLNGRDVTFYTQLIKSRSG